MVTEVVSSFSTLHTQQVKSAWLHRANNANRLKLSPSPPPSFPPLNVLALHHAYLPSRLEEDSPFWLGSKIKAFPLYSVCSLPKASIKKYHRLGWLETTDIYFLIALEARSLQSRCQQAHPLSEGSREGRSLSPSSWLQCLPAIRDAPALCPLCLHPRPPPLYTCLFSS